MENYELEHHGILGMKWGVRRYQNEDGSLTAAGEKRYNSTDRYARMKEKGEQLKKEAEEEYYKTETGKYEKQWRKKHPNDDWDNLGDDPKYGELYDKEEKILDAIDRKRSDANTLIGAKTYVKDQAVGQFALGAALATPVVAIATAVNIAKGKSAVAPLLIGGAFATLNAASAAASAPKDLEKVAKKYGL